MSITSNFSPPQTPRNRRLKSPFWVQCIYLLSMFAGVLAKVVWDSLNDTDLVNVSWQHLIKALIIAPLVFAGIYARLDQHKLSLVGLTFAFQNGFFWQVIFSPHSG